jgi:hypothetical protein
VSGANLGKQAIEDIVNRTGNAAVKRLRTNPGIAVWTGLILLYGTSPQD